MSEAAHSESVIDQEANDILNSINLPELNLEEFVVNEENTNNEQRKENGINEWLEENVIPGETQNVINLDDALNEVEYNSGTNALEAQMVNNPYQDLDSVGKDTDSTASSNYNVSSARLQLQSITISENKVEESNGNNNNVKIGNPFNDDDEVDFDKAFAMNLIASKVEVDDDEVKVDEVHLNSNPYNNLSDEVHLNSNPYNLSVKEVHISQLQNEQV